MYTQNQVPAISGAPTAKGNPYLSSLVTGWQKLVEGQRADAVSRLGVDQHADRG